MEPYCKVLPTLNINIKVIYKKNDFHVWASCHMFYHFCWTKQWFDDGLILPFHFAVLYEVRSLQKI